MKSIGSTIVLLFVLFITNSCRKPSFDDLSGANTITGIALEIRTLNAKIDTLPLKNKLVFLKNNVTDSSYIYAVLTDANGIFSFTNVSSHSYTISASDTVENIPYYSNMIWTPNNNSLYLYPDQRKLNGLILVLTDSLNSPLNNATVYRYVNRIFYDSSFLAGVVDSFTTDINGRVRYLNMPADSVYLIGKITFNNKVFKGKKAILIPKTGVVSDKLLLRLQ